MFKTLQQKFKNLFKGGRSKHKSVIIPRKEHNISRANISDNALKVLYRLKKGKYKAYLVGGSVRDLLLGLQPKDFDVATDATPERVRKLFYNCRLIGRRFRLAHVHFGREIVEVATFRRSHDGAKVDDAHMVDGMLVRDNVYGTLEEDAYRRDFTINALYYDINNFSVVDFCGGVADLKAKVIRSIGSPDIRIPEDPVRILRAIKFAAKLGFTIDTEFEQGIYKYKDLLANVASARLFEEIQKLFLSGYSYTIYNLLKKYNLFTQLFPHTKIFLEQETSFATDTLLAKLFQATDARIQAGKRISPAYLFAGVLWHPILYQSERNTLSNMADYPAMMDAIDDVVLAQNKTVAIPKRITLIMREIWVMQIRLTRRRGKRAIKLLDWPRFRAGYDFLLLRNESGENLSELSEWWTKFIKVDDKSKFNMIKEIREKE